MVAVSAAGVVFLSAMISLAGDGVAAGAPAQSDAPALLDVPYFSQTPELCGGAAVSMVLRYWGARDVFPQDFAPLVRARDGGILTSILASAVRDRGWQALVVPVADETARTRIRSEIDRGRPLIALLQVGPRTYHYVVIVASTEREVVVHDPARSPFRVLSWTEFDRAWTATGRWLMLVLPPSGFRPDEVPAPASQSTAEAIAVDSGPTPCRALVERGVRLAIGGDRDGAEAVLVAAAGLCPSDAAAWRELAGLRFSQSRWSEARDLALAAVRLAPEDAHAWQIVATSRYLMSDAMGALDAWNRSGEPRLETVDVHGAKRTRHPVVTRAVGLQPRQILTREAFSRALRRVRELPVAANTRMRYELNEGGDAKVAVFLDERQVLPHGWLAIATTGARAVLLDELRLDVAGFLGGGELGSMAWRWSANRPRVALDLAFPSPQWLPGVASFSASWERQSYAAGSSSDDRALVVEERRRVALHVSDWQTSWLRWQVGGALDRWSEYVDLDDRRFATRNALALESSLEMRLASDRLALSASGGWWAPIAGGSRFSTTGLLAAWRSRTDPTRPFWSAAIETSTASRAAPLALWPGAGTGQARSGLLRAHSLLDGGVLTGPVFGRDVARGSIEYGRPVARTIVGTIAIAGFVDAARAWNRRDGFDGSPLYADAGIGMRVHPPGSGGAIRIDVAHGLRGGGTALSASWGAAWPR